MKRMLMGTIFLLISFSSVQASGNKPVTAIKQTPAELGAPPAKMKTDAKAAVKIEKTARPVPSKSADATAAKSTEPTVEILTNLGAIVIKLFPQKAPVTVKNFLKYVDEKFYDNTVFHRVISDFMIQGGGLAKEANDLAQKPTASGIINEARNGLKNSRGTIAMARRSMANWDDANSTTSQFFINVKDNHILNYPEGDGYGYAVFGEVIKGMNVVDKIKDTETRVRPLKMLDENNKLLEQPMSDVPVRDIVIISVKRI